MVRDLTQQIEEQDEMPMEWRISMNVPIYKERYILVGIDPIHVTPMMNKKRGLAGKCTANMRVSR